MRHQRKRHKLGRGKGHRASTLAALSSALIKHKRIRTTVPKAKALRPFVEPLITRSKEDTPHNRRQVFRHLRSKEAVSELFNEVAVQVGDRPGGYTRIVKLGMRAGDGAELAMIELVDYNDVQPETGGGRSRSRTRRGSGKGRRRRKRGGTQAETQEAQPTTTTTEVEDQSVTPDDAMKAGAATEAVETPVDDAQAEPVQERTEDAPQGIEPEAADEAQEATEAAAAEEPEAAADEPEATDEDDKKDS
ncbi:MAG: 50S ribosomal protein L17 [Bacteroidetes bacterium]|jgi:large subunit ribosomal protein L17|nr:50S ribosomal protein L17 [Bacteroidota bacterium]